MMLRPVFGLAALLLWLGPALAQPADRPTGQALQLCKRPFEEYVRFVLAACDNWSGRADDGDIIENAKAVLIRAGVLSAADFEGVEISWCPLGAGAWGMTPAKDRVLLNPILKSDMALLARNLGHEMFHVGQYRRWGTDEFQCRYSQELLRTRSAGRDNAVEADAYAFADHIGPAIDRVLKSGTGKLPSR
jgi:hypothetical protein